MTPDAQPRPAGSDPLGAALIGAVVLGFAALEGRVGIQDTDAIAFTCGARSIQTVGSYDWPVGQPIVHWPPAYAALLSLFPDPLTAAFGINYLSLWAFGVGVLTLTRTAGWDRPAAWGYAAAVTAGLVRVLATNAKPDALTYAMCVWGLVATRRPSAAAQLAGFALLDAAVVFKQVAVVFTPAVVAALVLRSGWRPLARPTVLAGLAGLGLAVAWLVGYNVWVAGRVYTEGHIGLAGGSLAGDVVEGGKSLVRAYLGAWYGTVSAGPGRVLFPLVAGLGLICHLTLLGRRPRDGGLVATGALMLAGTALLRLAVDFALNTRLIGYGVVAAVAGWPPPTRTRWLWAAYGAAAVAAGGANSLAVNTYGGNDPRYVEAAADARAFLPLPAEPVESNLGWAYYVHAGIPIAPAGRNASHYLELILHTPVPDADRPPGVGTDGWRLKAEAFGSRLWVRRP